MDKRSTAFKEALFERLGFADVRLFNLVASERYLIDFSVVDDLLCYNQNNEDLMKNQKDILQNKLDFCEENLNYWRRELAELRQQLYQYESYEDHILARDLNMRIGAIKAKIKNLNEEKRELKKKLTNFEE